jgi:hypothetical protein
MSSGQKDTADSPGEDERRTADNSPKNAMMYLDIKIKKIPFN